MCQVTVVSPLLFRRHSTERPTWPPRGPTWTCSGGGSPSHHRGPRPDPCASAANVRAFLRAAHHPRPRLCRVCALAVPLGTPACAGPPVFAEGGLSSAPLLPPSAVHGLLAAAYRPSLPLVLRGAHAAKGGRISAKTSTPFVLITRLGSKRRSPRLGFRR